MYHWLIRVVQCLDDCSSSFAQVGGQEKIRRLWQHYYQNTDGLIFVVDSNDQERIEEAREELLGILSSPDMSNVPIVVIANKQDLPRKFSRRQENRFSSFPFHDRFDEIGRHRSKTGPERTPRQKQMVHSTSLCCHRWRCARKYARNVQSNQTASQGKRLLKQLNLCVCMYISGLFSTADIPFLSTIKMKEKQHVYLHNLVFFSFFVIKSWPRKQTYNRTKNKATE